jgi:ribosomal protein S18 acetylase RimI-like enzyme
MHPSDAAAIRRLAQRGWSAPPPWSSKDLRHFLTAGLNYGLIAVAGNRPVGFLLYSVSIHNATIVLHQVTVPPRWHRRGVGSLLLRTVREFFRSIPWARITMLVHERNLPAQLFLRAAGFQVTTIHHGCCAGEDDEYLFESGQMNIRARGSSK